MLKKILYAASALFIFIGTDALHAEVNGQFLLKQIEEIQKMVSDIRAKVELTQTKKEQGTKKTEMIYYRRDSDDSFLIVMTAPESDKGNGYIRVGDNFWMYRRNTRTFQHITRDESIGGSDAKAENFETRKLTELYSPVGAVTEEKLGAIAVYKFETKAKVNDVDYPKKIYWIRKDNYLPLKMQSYSMSGTLMQTSYYLNYTIIEGRFVAVKMLFIDEFEKGNKTLVEISGVSTQKLDNSLFTKAYLENISK
jgi:outer membrane lipoprotein-sorting protein